MTPSSFPFFYFFLFFFISLFSFPCSPFSLFFLIHYYFFIILLLHSILPHFFLHFFLMKTLSGCLVWQVFIWLYILLFPFIPHPPFFLFFLFFLFFFLHLSRFIYFFLFKFHPISFPNKYPIYYLFYLFQRRKVDCRLYFGILSGVFDGFYVLDNLQGLG